MQHKKLEFHWCKVLQVQLFIRLNRLYRTYQMHNLYTRNYSFNQLPKLK
jgi:hypothetical protein